MSHCQSSEYHTAWSVICIPNLRRSSRLPLQVTNKCTSTNTCIIPIFDFLHFACLDSRLFCFLLSYFDMACGTIRPHESLVQPFGSVNSDEHISAPNYNVHVLMLILYLFFTLNVYRAILNSLSSSVSEKRVCRRNDCHSMYLEVHDAADYSQMKTRVCADADIYAHVIAYVHRRYKHMHVLCRSEFEYFMCIMDHLYRCPKHTSPVYKQVFLF